MSGAFGEHPMGPIFCASTGHVRSSRDCALDKSAQKRNRRVLASLVNFLAYLFGSLTDHVLHLGAESAPNIVKAAKGGWIPCIKALLNPGQPRDSSIECPLETKHQA